MIRVLIADDHHLFREGIRALLERNGGIEVVGEAANGQEAVEMAERLAPDVVLMDINMPRLNGIQAMERIRSLHLAARIVALSMYSDPTLVRQAMQVGAKGYLLKTSFGVELMLAVEAAYRGDVYLSRVVAEPLVSQALRSTSSDGFGALERLSPREREVLKLIVESKSTVEIADLLVLSAKTVEKHRTNLMNKLGVHEVAGLVRLAIKHKLIFLDE